MVWAEDDDLVAILVQLLFLLQRAGLIPLDEFKWKGFLLTTCDGLAEEGDLSDGRSSFMSKYADGCAPLLQLPSVLSWFNLRKEPSVES